MRTLHLTNPLERGADVKTAQTRLHNHGFLAAEDVDGVFGPHSALACEVAKYRLGYASADIKPTYGDLLDSLLKGTTKPSKEMVKRANARKGISFQKFEEQALRARIVTIAHWGISNTHAIHYQQRRPIDGINHPYQLPLYTDCSGFVTLCYKWSGSPDPNGRGFDGEGYTGTLLSHCRPIYKAQLELGDIVVWGNFPGHHTALVIERGSDPLLASHGEESDPRAIRLSVESRYQPAAVHYLRIPEWS